MKKKKEEVEIGRLFAKKYKNYRKKEKKKNLSRKMGLKDYGEAKKLKNV